MKTRMASLLFVAAMLALAAGCESAEESMGLRKPTARLMGVQFREADAYGATIVFDVQIVNYYPVALPLLRFSYAVSSRGERFIAGASELAVQIPVGGSQTVSLPARIDYLKTLQRLGGVRPGATIPYETQLDLTISTPRFGAIALPLSKAGEITLPQVSGIDLDKILSGVKSAQ